MNITSNLDFFSDPSHNKPIQKLPIDNIITLLEHIVNVTNKKPMLLHKLSLLMDNQSFDQTLSDQTDIIENELDFIDKYTKYLQSQVVVIMNEHNVTNIPSIQDIQNRLLNSNIIL